MNKDQVQRILKLVEEGKISAQDAAELIEALQDSETSQQTSPPEAPEPPKPPKEPEPPKDFNHFMDAVERLGKDVAGSVNWQEISSQVRENLHKGAEAVKRAAEEAKKGRWSFVFGLSEERTVELPFQLSEGGTVKVELHDGDVKVLGGQPETKVIARARISGTDLSEIQARAASYSPMIEESQGVVIIRNPEGGGIQADLEIHLASPASVEVRGHAGDISVQGTRGAARIETSSGDVRLEGLQGSIEVRSSSSDITLKDSGGQSVVLENKSGDIRLSEVSGVFNLRTASGDVHLERLSAQSLSVEAVSGDIRADLKDPISGAVNLRTVQGSVDLELADGSDCRVTLSTLRGSVDCLLDLVDYQHQDRRVTGRLGEGAGTLDVSAVTGDIRARQRILR